ncbi:phage major capsid protein E [Clostridium aceticum]|uniref:Phage major capsid protein E n=1 Tax=Clostridium aceticum TaxID=84022 RepID=A0A0D8ICV4_9CLOT|nr:major capsid protein [Clostridium aceticum]AKL95009.1 phage major capsid protein E [Clostridium aceticum]KJF27909.1 phage capsid protein [Clostridium aceticum]
MGNINIYSTRTMMKAIKLMKPVRTFLRDTFFPKYETFLTEHVDVDYKKGKRKMAPFVAPRVGGVIMDREGYVTNTYKTPKIAPTRVTTQDDISRRVMGEDVYSTRTPEERARELLAQDLIELDDYITRREEWMCREVLFGGKVVMKGEGFEQVLDFNFTNKEILAAGALWTADTSDPIADMKRWRLKIIQKTGMTPNICIMASDVVDTFINHGKVQKLLDIQRLNIGAIEPSVKAEGITFIGKLPLLGLEIYSYDEWFLDDTGEEQPMVPEKHVLMGVTGSMKRLYGAVTQIENGQFVTIEGIRIPKSWVDEDNEVRKLRIATRPLPVPEDVDSWHNAIVK